jgi:hypothetical protein
MLDLTPLRFDYRGTPEMAASSLAQVIESKQWSGVAGSVSLEKVKLYPHVPWWLRKRHCSVFVGRFISTSDGSALIGRFRLEWPVALLFVFFVGITIYQGATTSSSRLWLLAVPAIALTMLWTLDAFRRKEIVYAIQASI